jgi:hypothetical protein
VRRFTFIALLVVAYAAAFALFQPVVGDSVVALTVIPLVLGGWIYGLRSGTLVAVVIVLLNLLLLQSIGGRHGFRTTEIPRIFMAIGLGAAAGWGGDA